MLLSLHDNPFHTMKKTLLLALLSVPFVLTACAKNKAATPSGTAVAAASQAVIEAPASVTGKTLITKSSPSGIQTYVFSQGSNTAKTIVDGMPYRAEYKKTAAKTAQITLSPWMPSDSGFKYIELTFSGTNSGTYRVEEETCTDGSEPNRVIDSGLFIIQ